MENDAVFLPGKIHGCEWQVYIIYWNPDCSTCGGWEIQIVDKERILQCYEESRGMAPIFFEALPDVCQGEWYWTDEVEEYRDVYDEADFIEGRDGGQYEEMMFLVDWAKGER